MGTICPERIQAFYVLSRRIEEFEYRSEKDASSEWSVFFLRDNNGFSIRFILYAQPGMLWASFRNILQISLKNNWRC